ncbi:MAG: prepilin-type N-terminal cleavage/methylation domain-containing protein [Verrucomicrobia bacterium]|nr:prepilin-type N-terminal cleavage/methylation domain-containing protein [Verrucomicrobiota bacterium]
MKIQRSSTKGFTLVEIMIVVVIIGLLAAMAIPAFQKVRDSSTEKAVLNNLRQVNSAAQQYMLENGVTVVAYTDIVGTETTKYIKTINPAGKEVYTAMSVNNTLTQLSISVPSLQRAVIFTQ